MVSRLGFNSQDAHTVSNQDASLHANAAVPTDDDSNIITFYNLILQANKPHQFKRERGGERGEKKTKYPHPHPYFYPLVQKGGSLATKKINLVPC
jgi:hypothetical protein